MSITKILNAKDMDVEAQVSAVAEVVAKARQSYGNEDTVIEAPMVETVNGRMNFVHLDAESQVAGLRGEVGRIKAAAVEFVTQNEGANLNKKVEELLAINPFFVNVGNGTKFEYL